MRSLIISSALLVILAQCGYPVAENSYPTTPGYPTPPPSYQTPKKYPVAPTYPTKPSYPSPPVDYAQKPSYSAPPPPPSPSGYISSDNDVASDSEYTTYAPTSEYRKRAKARTAQTESSSVAPFNQSEDSSKRNNKELELLNSWIMSRTE